MAHRGQSRVVYVLLYCEDGNGEIGTPQAVFDRKPTMRELLNMELFPAESLDEITELFDERVFWWKKTQRYP